MDRKYFEDQVFDAKDFTTIVFEKGDYEGCQFNNCDLSKADISDTTFIECSFHSCNLSMARVNKTAFQEVKFVDCKLLGIQFENCSDFLFSIDCDKCNLNFCTFGKLKLRQSKIRNSSLQDADFTGTDASQFVFDGCDLSRARFENTDLTKADFRTATNYSIDPEINKIKKARFALEGLPGLLDKYDITVE